MTCFTITYSMVNFFPMAKQPPSGPGTPHYRGFTITLRYTTLGRAPLDERSAQRRSLYLTTHNTHKEQAYMLPAGFAPAVPASDRPQTHSVDRAATWFNNVVESKILA
jgi:hypothetical protein